VLFTVSCICVGWWLVSLCPKAPQMKRPAFKGPFEMMPETRAGKHEHKVTSVPLQHRFSCIHSLHDKQQQDATKAAKAANTRTTQTTLFQHKKFATERCNPSKSATSAVRQVRTCPILTPPLGVVFCACVRAAPYLTVPPAVHGQITLFCEHIAGRDGW
jgi:hypothetical protein